VGGVYCRESTETCINPAFVSVFHCLHECVLYYAVLSACLLYRNLKAVLLFGCCLCSINVCCAVQWQHISTTEIMDGTVLVVGEAVGIGKFCDLAIIFS
jgi:hypothetical protein